MEHVGALLPPAWALVSHAWSPQVFVTRAVYELGFHIIHSDADSSWFRDPLEWFRKVRA